MNLGSILSFFFLTNHKKWAFQIFLAGVSIGVAISFKQIAVATFVASLCFLFNYCVKERTLKDKCLGLFLFSLGTAIAIALTILPLYFSDVSLQEYTEGTWLILLKSGSSTSSLKTHIMGFFKIWGESRIVIFYPFLYLSFLHRSILKNTHFTGLFVWLLFDFIGANASGNYYGHQIKQIMPSLSIIVGVTISHLIANIEDKNIKRQF